MNVHVQVNELDADLAETAAHQFEPWDKEAGGLTPESLNAHAPKHIRNAWFALQMMYQTKEKMAAYAKAEPEDFMQLCEAFDDSKEAFEEIGKLCGAAHARMIVAAASAAVVE